MAHTVIGVFDRAHEAQQAVQALVDHGFSGNQVDISTDLATGNMGSSTGVNDREAYSDSVGNFFGSLFGSGDQSSSYSQVARNSGAVVTVHAQSADDAQRAARILDDNGALDIDERAAQYGYASNTGTMNAATTDTTANTGTSIPVIEEELQVGKREIQTGGVRLRSRIVERPVEESLRLRSEHIRVERNPVNRPASEADFAAFQEGTVEMTEYAEVPVVSKETRVVEEISLRKEVEEREETIQDTVRRTEVEVDNVAGSDRSVNTGSTMSTVNNLTGSNASTSLTVTHLFNDRDSLENAYEYVRKNGYDEDEVNVVMTDETRKRHFGEGHTSGVGERALEGAGTGSAIGGTLGAILGAIAAIGTSVALPGLGLVVAGPLAAGLAGAGAGGLTGGLLGALTKAGLSEDKAKQYQTGIEQGGVLLSVDAHSQEDARRIEQEWQSLDKHNRSASM